MIEAAFAAAGAPPAATRTNAGDHSGIVCHACELSRRWQTPTLFA